jgi:hypothetical protein
LNIPRQAHTDKDDSRKRRTMSSELRQRPMTKKKTKRLRRHPHQTSIKHVKIHPTNEPPPSRVPSPSKPPSSVDDDVAVVDFALWDTEEDVASALEALELEVGPPPRSGTSGLRSCLFWCCWLRRCAARRTGALCACAAAEETSAENPDKLSGVFTRTLSYEEESVCDDENGKDGVKHAHRVRREGRVNECLGSPTRRRAGRRGVLLAERERKRAVTATKTVETRRRAQPTA